VYFRYKQNALSFWTEKARFKKQLSLRREVKQLTANQQATGEKSFSSLFGSIKIKIPARLSSKIAHSAKLRRSLDTYLLLKAQYESGKVELNKASRQELELLCGKHFKTLHSRLKHLHSLHIVEYSKERVLLCSWEKLAEIFEYEMKGNYYVRSDGSRQVSDILEALFMREKESDCKAQFKRKIKHEDVKQELENVAGSTNTEAVQHCQLYHYLREYSELSEDEKFYLYEIARADTSLSYRLWSYYFDLHSRGGFAYKKRKLQKLGLLAVEKRAWIIKGTHKTRALRKSILGTAPYVPKLKQVVFFMPDKLTYLSPSVSLAKEQSKALELRAKQAA